MTMEHGDGFWMGYPDILLYVASLVSDFFAPLAFMHCQSARYPAKK